MISKKFFGMSLVGILACASFTTAAQAEEPRVAKIMKVVGTAVVVRDSQRYFAQPGMLLVEGDVVRSLEKSKVSLKYSSCDSVVNPTMEVTISEKSQCDTGAVAKAADLKAPETGNYKVERIDANLAEASCNACKVQLASSITNPGIFSSAAKFAAIPLIPLALSGSSGSGSSDTSVSQP